MPNDQDRLIISITKDVVEHLKSNKTAFYDMPNLSVLVEAADFTDRVKKLIETLPIDSLKNLANGGPKAIELAKSIERVMTSFTTPEAALDNFKNLDKSKFVKNSIDWAQEICSCLNANRAKLDLNSNLKPEQQLAAALATKVIDDKTADKIKIVATATGIIAGMTAKRPLFFGFWETNSFASDLSSNKPAISHVVGSIFDEAVKLASTNKLKVCTPENAMLIGKEIGIKTYGEISKLVDEVNILVASDASECKTAMVQSNIPLPTIFNFFASELYIEDSLELQPKQKTPVSEAETEADQLLANLKGDIVRRSLI